MHEAFLESLLVLEIRGIFGVVGCHRFIFAVVEGDVDLLEALGGGELHWERSPMYISVDLVT